MRATEFITEGLSSVVYHYTSIGSALDILKSREFSLTSIFGSIEQQYAPKGYPYFLSTTRTRHGGYHSNVTNYQGVLFELDGRWYSQRYKASPIDYWQDKNAGNGRKHEAEDRIFSKNDTMSIGGIRSIHVLFSPEDSGTTVKSYIRNILLLAKKLGISAYLYTDNTAWLNFDKRNLASVDMLKHSEKPEYSKTYMSSRPKGYMLPWIQLMHGKTVSDLSYDAIKLARNLQYDYDLDREVRALNNDLDGVRRATAAFKKDRENLIKIVKYIRQHKLSTITEFAVHLRDKWKNIIDN